MKDSLIPLKVSKKISSQRLTLLWKISRLLWRLLIVFILVQEFMVCPNCKNTNNIYKKIWGGEYNVFYCNRCQNGFTFPKPKNLGKYYHDQYWITKGVLGNIKTTLYSLFQSRRKNWVSGLKSSGDILDVGSGEGNFGKSMSDKYRVTNLDASFSQLANPNVVTSDFLKWKTNKNFDAIVFWESFEHVESPKNYLKKAVQILKPNGYIFIECPQFNSAEAWLFGRYWFHLDLPRHLNHLTKNGVAKILKDQNLKVVRFQNIFAPEYVIWGFIASFFSLFSINITDPVKKGNYLIFFPILILAVFATIVEILFYVFRNTPIMLVVAQKNEK